MNTPFEFHLNFGDDDYLIFDVTKERITLTPSHGGTIELTPSHLNDIEMAAKIVATHAYGVLGDKNG